MGSHDLTTDVWGVDAREYPSDGSIEERARFLLRYAILAPSSHNSQPWQFDVDGARIAIHAADERWLEVADRDRRELYVSIGCAVENLLVAAEHFDLDHRIDYPDDGPAAVVTLDPDGTPSSGRPPGLFDDITERRTDHHPFEEGEIDRATHDRLRGSVLEDDVALHLVDDPDRKRSVARLQAEADRLQMADPAYRRELGHWIGTGALGASWLAARIGQAVVSHLDLGDREARKNSKLVRSAPVVAVLTTPSDDPRDRIRTGQAFERLALAATADGLAVHPMSQILERDDLREDLADLLGDAGRPQHLFRLGYSDEQPEHTPRWPLEKVLAEGS